MGYTLIYLGRRSACRKPTFTSPTIPTRSDNYLTAPSDEDTYRKNACIKSKDVV